MRSLELHLSVYISLSVYAYRIPNIAELKGCQLKVLEEANSVCFVILSKTECHLMMPVGERIENMSCYVL